jgi:hypothetical protein
MQIYCTTEFVNNLNKLTKPKFINTYGTLKTEISDFFKQYDTFEKIWNKSYMLRESKFVRINKVRLENNLKNGGKSGGFRLITLCDNRSKDVVLVYVYPKTGPHGVDSTSNDLLVKIVKGYKKDRDNGKLIPYKQ